MEQTNDNASARPLVCNGLVTDAPRLNLRCWLKRIGRRVFWPRPMLYLPIGLIRHGKRGNVLVSNHDLYISGFPRSGNSFAVKAFLMANPGTPLRSHRHIPCFILVSVRRHTPGMVLIRDPVDAAISWSIYTGCPLQHTLQYYRDYYSVLLPYRDRIFLVSFEEVTRDFGQVIRAFNLRWKTDYRPFQHTPDNVALCVEQVETEFQGRDGRVREAMVPRPSTVRKTEKERLLSAIDRSEVLQEELRLSREIYHLLAPIRPAAEHKTGLTTD